MLWIMLQNKYILLVYYIRFDKDCFMPSFILWACDGSVLSKEI